MRFYMAFSREAGPAEGAFLVVDHNIRDAKRLAWRYGCPWDFMDYIDLGIRWIKGTAKVAPLADQMKLAAGEPHVVDSPESCETCGMWGAGLDAEGMCGECGGPPGEKLIELLMMNQTTERR